MTSAKERSLSSQLREVQASMAQADLSRIAAETARDQAEATLRNTQADLTEVLEVVVAGVAETPEAIPQERRTYLRQRYPTQFVDNL